MDKNNKNSISKNRLVSVDLLQGIAMLWVIFGHHLLDFMPAIYHSIHYYIYSFHMPFFIFISSFLIAYSYKEAPYRIYTSKKFHKFFLPYICIGTLVTLLTGVKEGIDTIPENILFLVFSPKQSASTFLWYIYLLFLLYAIYPLCKMGYQKIGDKLEILILFVGLYFYFNPIRIQFLCIDYLTNYFLFYWLGIMTAWNFKTVRNYIKILRVTGGWCLFLFILLSVSIFISPQHIAYTALCFCSIPAMYGLARILSYQSFIKNALISISKNCFHIYLIHMFFIQGIAVIFMKLHPYKIESVGGMAVYIVCSTIISIIGSITAFRIIDYIKVKTDTNSSFL